MDVVTTVLAVWGAVLSTVLALFEVYKWRREETPQLKVFGHSVWLEAEGCAESREYYCLTAVNLGTRPVTICGCHLTMADGGTVTPPPARWFKQPLPAKLAPGDDLRYIVQPGALCDATTGSFTAGIVVADTAGRAYSGALLGPSGLAGDELIGHR